MTTTDQQQAAAVDGLRQLGEQLPLNRHLGVEVVEVRPGLARTRPPADERLANHVGEVLAPALRAADAGERPRFDVEVAVTDTAGTPVALASLRFVYLAPPALETA